MYLVVISVSSFYHVNCSWSTASLFHVNCSWSTASLFHFHMCHTPARWVDKAGRRPVHVVNPLWRSPLLAVGSTVGTDPHRKHVARRAVVPTSCEHILAPLHPIALGQSPILIIKFHPLVVFALPHNITYDSITMRIRNREGTILLAPTHKFRKEPTLFGPITT